MKRWIFFAALVWIAVPRLGHTAPSVTWDGPPCAPAANEGLKACSAEPGGVPEKGGSCYNQFKVCSTEPNVSDSTGDAGPCYVSHFANYIPDAVEIALIEVCQRAKVALDAPPGSRGQSIERVISTEYDLKDAVEDNPALLEDHRQEVGWVGKDFVHLGERTEVYAMDSSEENWQTIVNVLWDLEDHATVIGGSGF